MQAKVVMRTKKAKSPVKKPQPKKEVEKDVKDVKDSATVDDILCIYHTAPFHDEHQKTLELLALISAHYEELEKRGDKLLDRLVAATTVSDEVKNVMLRESENILRAKCNITHVKIVMLTRLCSSSLEEDSDPQNISNLFTESDEDSTQEITTPQI